MKGHNVVAERKPTQLKGKSMNILRSNYKTIASQLRYDAQCFTEIAAAVTERECVDALARARRRCFDVA